MSGIEMNVQRRAQLGKGGARKLRGKGMTPAVFYGAKTESAPVTFSGSDLQKLLRGHTWSSTLIRFKSDDSKLNGKTVLLKDWELHPISQNWMHADFVEVDLTKKIQVTVPLRFTGRAKGVADGGILQPIHREVVLKVTPTAIPAFLEVDVTEVTSAKPLHFSDLKLAADYELVSKPGDAVVTVVAPQEEEVAVVAPVAGAEGAAAPAAGAEGAAAPAAGAAGAAKPGEAAKAGAAAPAAGAAGAAPKKDKK